VVSFLYLYAKSHIEHIVDGLYEAARTVGIYFWNLWEVTFDGCRAHRRQVMPREVTLKSGDHALLSRGGYEAGFVHCFRVLTHIAQRCRSQTETEEDISYLCQYASYLLDSNLVALQREILSLDAARDNVSAAFSRVFDILPKVAQYYEATRDFWGFYLERPKLLKLEFIHISSLSDVQA
jgi:hypothetical protein